MPPFLYSSITSIKYLFDTVVPYILLVLSTYLILQYLHTFYDNDPRARQYTQRVHQVF